MRDSEDAQEYLRTFYSSTKKAGEKCYAEGRIVTLTQKRPGVAYAASIFERPSEYDVTLDYDEASGWEGHCSCGSQNGCQHIYAAMKALLAESSVLAVREISTGALAASHTPPTSPSKAEKIKLTVNLAEKASTALNRPLTRAEIAFCKKISSLFLFYQQHGRITYWELGELGLNIQGFYWGADLTIGTPPENEFDLWLNIASAVVESGQSIPKFLESITDLAELRRRVVEAKRKAEIENWKAALRNAATAPPPAPAPSLELSDTEVRVSFDAEKAALEWRRPGGDFSTMKAKQLDELLEAQESGQARLSPESLALCVLFAGSDEYTHRTEVHYDNNASQAILARILRTRDLESLTVNGSGEVLLRPPEPLRWAVESPVGDNGDYGFRLARRDGADLDPVICCVHGNPSLYVTRYAVFHGPSHRGNILPPGQETRIPAKALETQAGLQFITALGVEIPERIRERVRHVRLEVLVECELKHPYPMSASENCCIKITAASPDGKVSEAWMGDRWEERSSLNQRRDVEESNSLVVYDRSLAQQVADLARPLGLKPDVYHQRLFLRVTKKFPDLFVTWLKSLPPEARVRLAGELASLAQEAVSGTVRLDVQEAAIDWFDLRVVVDVSDTTLTQDEIKLLLNAKGGYVRLGDKGWRRLQFNLTQEEDERLANLGLNPRELTAEPQRLHALQLADAAARRFLPEHQAEQIQRRASEIKARVTPPLPKGVNGELRPYQVEGFHFLAYLQANRFGGILADDMGLGKTLQTLCWLLWLQEGHPAAKPSLVVCPKSVMDNWEKETGRFTPTLRVKRWSAPELSDFAKRLGEADLHVINYSQLRMLGESLIPVQWLAVVLDEGQYIKNPNSQTTQVARALRADHRLILSGTPIENRLLDLWSLMSFAMPGLLSSRTQFAKLYDTKGDPLARRRLAARVRPFLIRRTKQQVAKDLPDRIEEDVICELEGEQKQLYRAELKRAQQNLLRIKTKQQLNEQRFNFLTSLLRLRQICCHPALVKADTKESGAKMEALLDRLEPLMEEGHKVLVFSQFVELLNLLKPKIAERGWPLFCLTGETEDRGGIVDKFQALDSEAVFLISLKAGGFGLNLTAASYVVLFDPWWNPAVENQAIDRTHRIGQENTVIAYRLLIKDSVEEKIRALQKQKSALATDVFGEERFAQGLSLDDLQFLLAD